MTPEQLIALAERCEREKPTFALECEIGYALHNSEAPGCVTWHRGVLLIDRRGTPLNRIWEPYRPPRFAYSVDAAISVVPRGMGWEICTNGWRAMVSTSVATWVGRHDGNLALALCSAGLQAQTEVVRKRQKELTA